MRSFACYHRFCTQIRLYVYGANERDQLKIILSLRNAHCPIMVISRMQPRLNQGEMNLRQVIETPDNEEDIVNAADRYCTALQQAEQDAIMMMKTLSLILAL